MFDGASSAALWASVHGDALLESALSSGAKDWSWHHHSWGVVLELEFADAKAWDDWRALPVVQAALDGVPDPISGLIVYRGRGGTSGSRNPRKPRPLRGSGSAALPLPWEWQEEGPALLPSWPSSLLLGGSRARVGAQAFAGGHARARRVTLVRSRH
ncbi:MAG TPA: hypothetical protein VL984_03910 [Acidimicrobiales bacterium]|nr:hypothetical protein [Acidimicrobiales bacterium]